MRTISALILLFTLVPCLLSAQVLPRRASFGVVMEYDSAQAGIVVHEVLANTTADQMGLQSGDMLMEVNGLGYQNVSALVETIDTWQVGDLLQLKVNRGGKKKSLRGRVAGMPMETSEHGKVIYGAINYDGGKLLSILELPDDVEKPPVVFFLPGVGCGTLDFCFRPNATIKLLVESLVEQGFAVFRVDKPGEGDGQGTQMCREMDYDYEVEAFRTALTQLKQNNAIDSSHVFLYGHSLGTVTAPLIAAQEPVAGIIAWGGIASSWFEYEIKRLRKQQVLYGTDHEIIEAEYRRKLPFLIDLYVHHLTRDELAAKPEYEALVEQYFHGNLFLGMHHFRYFHQLSDVDLLTAYKHANCPVLALAGEYDVHAINTDWAKELAAAVDSYDSVSGQYHIVPKTTHHYHTAPSIAEYNDMRWNGRLSTEYMAEHFNPEVPKLLTEWLKKQLS